MSRYIHSILHAAGAAVLVATVMAGGTLFLAPEDVRGAQDTLPVVDPGYRLGGADVMMISVWKDEQLTREVVVRPDGVFSFPLVGDVQADLARELRLRTGLVISSSLLGMWIERVSGSMSSRGVV